jgi:hypothetical protein
MFLWRLKHVAALSAVLALLVGGASLAYARWSGPLLEADAALAAKDTDRALAAYTRVEQRFRWLPLAQRILPHDFARAVYNQLALLYGSGDYDAVIAKAETAPSGAAPRFWTGCAFFSLASTAEKPEVRLVWLTRAEGEFRQALEASPDDWDAKYNYEVTARLAEQLRKKPTVEPETLMQLLRPQQKQPRAVRKTG